MERKFKREIKSLDQISNFITDFISKNLIDDSIGFTVNLVIEELFTNMVKYNLESTSEISISLAKDGKKLVISLTDYEVEPFDITRTEEVNTRKPIEDRKPGGLGIHLVKRLVDKIDYEYEGRQSKITLVKNLEN